jgi:hypothetical protein
VMTANRRVGVGARNERAGDRLWKARVLSGFAQRRSA